MPGSYDARKPPGTVTAATTCSSYRVGQPREYVPRTPLVNPALSGCRPDLQEAALTANRGAAYVRSSPWLTGLDAVAPLSRCTTGSIEARLPRCARIAHLSQF